MCNKTSVNTRPRSHWTLCPGGKGQQASGWGPPPLLPLLWPLLSLTQGQYLESRAGFRQPSQLLWLEPSWVHFAISFWCKWAFTVGRGCSFCCNYARHNYSSRAWKQHRVLWRTSQGFFCCDIIYLRRGKGGGKAKGISKEEIITLFMSAFHSILRRNHKIRISFFLAGGWGGISKCWIHLVVGKSGYILMHGCGWRRIQGHKNKCFYLRKQ